MGLGAHEPRAAALSHPGPDRRSDRRVPAVSLGGRRPDPPGRLPRRGSSPRVVGGDRGVNRPTGGSLRAPRRGFGHPRPGAGRTGSFSDPAMKLPWEKDPHDLEANYLKPVPTSEAIRLGTKFALIVAAGVWLWLTLGDRCEADQ